MNTTLSKKSAADERLEAHREVIRRSLEEIATGVETALRDANLEFPVYLVIPNSGGAIITFATVLDPPDADWSKASAIVCQRVSDKLGGIRLGTRPLQCSVANAKIEAADVIPEPASECEPS